eukprot:79374-Pleurochrysis_carterae.AAC.1
MSRLLGQRRQRCEEGDAGGAVRPATAALWKQRCRRCENSNAGATKAAVLAALCGQRQWRS